MPYVLKELPDNGEPMTLGEPVHDIIVAKVIASRRAVRTQRVTVVTDGATGREVARFDPSIPAPKASATRIRADVPIKSDESTGVSIKKSG